MKRVKLSSRPLHRVLGLLVFVVALSAIACDSNVKFSPTQPDWPLAPVESDRSLEISGHLVAEQGSCFEATILFDGEELRGARSECAKAKGCAKLDLDAFVRSPEGHHTISFQVVRQSEEAIDYLVDGAVRVSREGIGLGGAGLALGPTRVRLQAGDLVTFEFEISN